MATRSEIEKQIAKLQEDLEKAPEYDEDEVLCVELPNGNKVYLKGERIAKYLRQHGLEVEDVEIEEGEEVPESPSETPKKAVAKKTAAPRKRAARKPVEPVEDELEEELEEDEQPEAPRSFWG